MHRLPAECLFFFISLFIYAYKFLSVINRYKPSDDLRGYLHPVDSRARDASRVSGALPAGIQPRLSDRTEILPTQDAHGRGCPRLGGGQDCFRHGVAGALTVKGAQSARKIPAGEIGQNIPHARKPEVLAAPVSGLYPSGHMYRSVSGKKISDRFDRNVVMIATRAEGGGLYAALERDGTQRKASVNRFIIRRLYRNGDRRVGVDAVTCPTAHPGHIQNVYTPRSPAVSEKEYSAAPRSGCPAIFP